MGVDIRHASAADLPRVLGLWAGSTIESTTDSLGSLEVLLARDDRSLLLAESGDELVGTLIVGWDGWRGGLYRLAVEPGWRRRGVASMLVKAGEERLRSLGARRIRAEVITEEEGAVAFWRSSGYELDPRLGRYVRMI
jgi:ribosomal protein S18 acetylase RimI-like enzyme